MCGVVALCCGVVTVVVSPSPQALASHRAYLLTARVPSKVSPDLWLISSPLISSPPPWECFLSAPQTCCCLFPHSRRVCCVFFLFLSCFKFYTSPDTFPSGPLCVHSVSLMLLVTWLLPATTRTHRICGYSQLSEDAAGLDL